MLTPAGYLIGPKRLLDYVEIEYGLPARIEAKMRAAKYADVWSQPLSLKLIG